MEPRYPRGARGPRINHKALEALRLAKGWTQTELAARTVQAGAKVAHSHISRLEAGIRTHPSPRITKALADALGVEVQDLLAADLEEVAG